MTKRVLTLIAVGALAASCSEPVVPGSGDQPLATALRSYAVEFLRRNPTTNTYLGGAGLDPSLQDVDGTLRDYSVASLQTEDTWLTETSRTLEAINADSLSPVSRVDRDVALAQIRFVLRQHQQRRYQERALDTYVVEPFRAIDWQLQGMSATGPRSYGTEDEWALVIKRLRTIPWFLDNARAQIAAGVQNKRTPDRRMLERDGITSAEANARFFGDTLPRIATERLSGAEPEALMVEVRDACRLASEAYLGFRDFIAATFFDGGTGGAPRTIKSAFAADQYAFGQAEYDWALTNNFKLTTTAAKLYDEAWPIVQKTRQQMIDLAKTIGAAKNLTLPADGGAAVRAIFDELSKDYPKSDVEMIDWYRQAAFRLVDYARQTGVFDVPAEYRLEVVETPPPLQASIDGAAYYPAPPFKTTGVGRFYVTPTHNEEAALKSNNRAALADLAAHEGFPGHDWYYKVLTEVRTQISPVRWLTPGAVEDSSSMWEDSMPAEGWGLYAEALMAEPQTGFPNGFYSPEERLYQLQGQLYRDLRVRVDTGIHTGKMSYDDAVTLFSEIVDFLPGPCAAGAAMDDAKRASCGAAERAIFRYSKWPTQAITYRLGKDQIFALRAEAEKRLGKSYSQKTFHLQFIRQGTIPANYFHDLLLERLATMPSMGASAPTP
jgi:uncharacterized protein (DUF885 family)